MNDEELGDDWLRHVTGWSFVIARPKRLGVAVSGGSDSMACLDLIIWHARENNWPIEAVTVDHGLRDEAKDEIALVAAFCEARGVPHSVLAWRWDGTGNLQAEARDGRYRLIAEWAREREIDTVALGHTRDDVAETFLMRLARRSGVDGLSEMDRRFDRHGISWVRPLQSHVRAEWREYLQRHDITWADDPTNEDTRFERVKSRKVLEVLSPLGIDADVLGDVAGNLRTARTALESYAYEEAKAHVREDRGDLLLPALRTAPDRVLPYDILTRLRAAALRWVGGGEYPPRRSALTDLDVSLAEGDAQTLAGCFVTSEAGDHGFDGHWRVTREHAAVRDLTSATTDLWDGRWRLDGPHAPALSIRALGDAITETPWRQTGMPRQSLLASPAVFDRETLVAAPMAGLSNGWRASATGRGTFAAFLFRR